MDAALARWLDAFAIELSSQRPDLSLGEIDRRFLRSLHAMGVSPAEAVRGDLPLAASGREATEPSVPSRRPARSPILSPLRAVLIAIVLGLYALYARNQAHERALLGPPSSRYVDDETRGYLRQEAGQSPYDDEAPTDPANP